MADATKTSCRRYCRRNCFRCVREWRPIFKVYQIIVTLLCTSKQKTEHNALRQGPEERRLRERHCVLEEYRWKLTARISSLGTRLSPEGGERVRPTTRRGGVSSPRPRTSTLPPRCVNFNCFGEQGQQIDDSYSTGLSFVSPTSR